MATYHYFASVTAYLESKNLDFVERDENAPNLPQCRPIEKFWALVKHKVSKYPNPPKNRRWSKFVIENSGLSLFRDSRNRLNLVKVKGPHANIRIKSLAMSHVQNIFQSFVKQKVLYISISLYE